MEDDTASGPPEDGAPAAGGAAEPVLFSFMTYNVLADLLVRTLSPQTCDCETSHALAALAATIMRFRQRSKRVKLSQHTFKQPHCCVRTFDGPWRDFLCSCAASSSDPLVTLASILAGAKALGGAVPLSAKARAGMARPLPAAAGGHRGDTTYARILLRSGHFRDLFCRTSDKRKSTCEFTFAQLV